MKSNPVGMLFQLGRAPDVNDLGRAEALGVIRPVGRGGEQHPVRSHGVAELQSHVAETAESDDSHLLPLANFPGPSDRRRTRGFSICKSFGPGSRRSKEKGVRGPVVEWAA